MLIEEIYFSSVVLHIYIQLFLSFGSQVRYIGYLFSLEHGNVQFRICTGLAADYLIKSTGWHPLFECEV